MTLIPGFDAPNRGEAIAATEKIAQDLQVKTNSTSGDILLRQLFGCCLFLLLQNSVSRSLP